jgi:hypothetical protein
VAPLSYGVEKPCFGEHPARLCSSPVVVPLFVSFSFLKGIIEAFAHAMDGSRMKVSVCFYQR